MNGQVAVSLARRTLHVEEPFDVVEELQGELGAQSVYLLESLSGPARDRERAIIGVGPVLSIEVADGRIRVDGQAPLAAAVVERIRRSGLVDDALVLCDLMGAWDVMRDVVSMFDVPQATDVRLDFGFLAVLAYDAVRYIEQLPRIIPPLDEPVADLAFTLYSSLLEVELRTSTGRLTTAHGALWESAPPDVIVSATERVRGRGARGEPAAQSPTPVPVAAVTEPEFLGWVDAALDHVRAGDVYQVQLGYDVELPTALDAGAIYRRMRRSNPSPFMGMVPLRGATLLSASPELHVLLSGGAATMRPIAGTAPRTGDPAGDAAAVEYLRTAEKEHAEHVMLVDLCRNDLGRVAAVGSTRTPTMMEVEPYSHVFHLVSTVTATVEEGYDVFDVIRATFPAGTMTGAPKIRAMEVIESLESTRRGLYAGIFGVIGVGGYANLALTIRSIVCTEAGASTRASAGVVTDSDPHSEWRETRHKMNAAVAAATGGVFR